MASMSSWWKLWCLSLLSALVILPTSPIPATDGVRMNSPRSPYPQGKAIPLPQLSEHSTTAEMQKRFHEFAVKTSSSERMAAVRSALSKNAGIYKHPSFNHMKGVDLSKTVLITLLFINNEINQYYNYFLENFLCFSEAHNLNPIIYVQASNTTVLHERIKYMQSRFVSSVPYPESLFWQIVAGKSNQLLQGKRHAHYDKDEPDFQGFGALVQLIPALEVLYHGYNVVYLDIDVAMVRDPIPFILRGHADLTMSLEPRSCQDYYSSAYPQFFDWKNIEPNTGVMHLRATKAGIAAFRRYIDHLVMLNILNDQQAFDRTVLQLQYDASCHASSYVDPGDPNSALKTNLLPTDASSSSSTASSSSVQNATYCFLDELLIQNGRIGVSCSHPGSRFREEWLVQMHNSGLRDWPATDARYPAILHVNYVSNKLHELRARGLWLFREESDRPGLSSHENPYCHPYDHRRTYFGAVLNWTEEVHQVLVRREEERNRHIRNGSLIKAVSSAAVYYVSENLTRHMIPNLDTFNFRFGGDFGAVATISSALMLSVAEGAPVPEVTAAELRGEKEQEVSVSTPPQTTATTGSVDVLRVFALRANRSVDETRFAHVQQTLSTAAGMYRSSPPASLSDASLSSSLAHSVLVAVFPGTWEEMHTADRLHNFLCFLDAHRLKVVLYVLPSRPATSSPSPRAADWQRLQSRGLYLLSYPEHMFWSALGTKKTAIQTDEGAAFYSSDMPSVQSYGQVVLLVPLLEVLSHGYDVLYLDVDALPVHDPVPHVLRGQADILLAMDTRECEEVYSSTSPHLFDWDRVEPSLAVMFLRATERGVHAVKQWVAALVRENRWHAKKAFQRKALALQYDASCHAGRGLEDGHTGRVQGQSGDGGQADVAAVRVRPVHHAHSHQRVWSLAHGLSNATSKESPATFCFLDELLFASSIGAECELVHFRDEWILEMSRVGLAVDNGTQRYPAVVRLHSVDDLRTHLQERGLWLAKNVSSSTGKETHWLEAGGGEERCHPWRPESSFFGRLDWEAERKASQSRREQIRRTYIRNGNVVKSLTRTATYYIDEKLTRHAIPDRSTLEQLLGGKAGGTVKSIPHAVIAKLPLGKPLSIHPSEGKPTKAA